MLASSVKPVISCRPHFQFCNVPVVLRRPLRTHWKRLNAPRIRISATFQSEEADDFDLVEDSEVQYEEDFEQVEERQSGVVKWFDNKKGFGFITKDDGSGDIFVHQTNINSSGYRSLREGEAVEFEEMVSEGDRVTAMDVTGPGGSEPLGTEQGSPFGDSYGGGGGGGYRQYNRYPSEPNTEMSESSSGLQLVVLNLPWSVDEDRLHDFFADYGPLECGIRYDDSGRSRGFGTVKFSSQEDAKEALVSLHGSMLDGRTISVRFDRFG